MNGSEIFAPFTAMLVLTLAVWGHMYVTRIGYMVRNKIDAQKMTTPDRALGLLPDAVNYAAYNLRNLAELPIAFYALCLMLFVTGQVDAVYVTAAWVFFVFRALHSLVHCTFNRVMLRFGFYMLSALALWFMPARAVIGMIA